MPSRIDLERTGVTTQVMAQQTRNVAGLVTKRRTDQVAATGPMPWIESNWAYDTLGRVTSQTVQKGANAGGATEQVAQQVLAYLGNDDPDSMVHTLGASGTNANAKTYAFGYDWRHQLTNTTVTQAAYGVAPYATTSGTAFAGTYDYGNAGRLKKANVGAGLGPMAGGEVKTRNVDYCYDPVDKERVVALKTAAATPCTGAAYATYAYDDAGNQTQRAYPAGSAPTSPSGSGSAETFDYVYDGDDRLRRVTKKVAGAVVASEEYWYDEQGARVGVLTRDSAGTKQELRWFIGDTQAHYDAAGVVTNVYSHLSLGTPIARVERTGNTTTAVEYQFHGLASNTIAAVGADGIVKANLAYAPYGELIEGQQPAGPAAGLAAHPRRMNDKYIDDLSSLAYYGARYYDNVLIGWTQRDPLYRRIPDVAGAMPRHANLYQFTLSNPLRYTDPDGRSAVDVSQTAAQREANQQYLQEIVGDQAVVVTETTAEGEARYLVIQEDHQKANGKSEATAYLMDMTASMDAVLLIQNVDWSKDTTPAQIEKDHGYDETFGVSTRNAPNPEVETHGGGSTARKSQNPLSYWLEDHIINRVSTTVRARSVINYTNLDETAPGTSGRSVPITAAGALYHEVVGHGWLDQDHPGAIETENRWRREDPARRGEERAKP